MILSSIATPPICTHRHTNLDPIPIVLCRRLSIYGNSFTILNCFVVSLNLLQMNRMFLKVPYPACPLQFLASLLRTSPNIQSENDWKSRSSYLILVTTGKLSLPRSRFLSRHVTLLPFSIGINSWQRVEEERCVTWQKRLGGRLGKLLFTFRTPLILEASLNPFSPRSDQHQFSPKNSVYGQVERL